MANVQQTLGTWYVYTNDVQDVILENAAFDFELMGPLGFKVQNLELYINGENVTDYGDMVQLGDGQFLFTFVGYEYDIPKGTYATIEVVGMPSSFTEDDAVAIVPKAQFLGVTDDSAEEFETTWVTASTLSN